MAPLELQALVGPEPGVNLRLDGPAGASVVVQRCTDLVMWTDGPLITLETTPTRITVPAAESREFFRLKKP
jgi:hypothetical protein